MGVWTKFLIVLLLGAAAAGLNWFILSAQVAPQSFVAVAQDLKPGEPFTEENLGKVRLSGDLGALVNTAIPYEHRAVLYGRPAPRELKKGDILFWRDRQTAAPVWDLKSDEVALFLSLEGVAVKTERLQVGDEIVFCVGRARPASKPDPTKPDTMKPDTVAKPALLEEQVDIQRIGPFRLLSVGSRFGAVQVLGDPRSQAADDRIISIAVKMKEGANGDDPRVHDLLVAKWAELLGNRQIVAVEVRPARRP